MTSTHHAAALSALATGGVLPDLLLGYIGPGAGLGALVVAVALVLGAILLLSGLVWYPLKRLLKKGPAEPEGGSPTSAPE